MASYYPIQDWQLEMQFVHFPGTDSTSTWRSDTQCSGMRATTSAASHRIKSALHDGAVRPRSGGGFGAFQPSSPYLQERSGGALSAVHPSHPDLQERSGGAFTAVHPSSPYMYLQPQPRSAAAPTDWTAGQASSEGRGIATKVVVGVQQGGEGVFGRVCQELTTMMLMRMTSE